MKASRILSSILIAGISVILVRTTTDALAKKRTEPATDPAEAELDTLSFHILQEDARQPADEYTKRMARLELERFRAQFPTEVTRACGSRQ